MNEQPKYEPKGGEVAMITFGASINENGPAFYVVEMDREDRWVFPDGTEEPATYPKAARPLVVIDPEDMAQFASLREVFRSRDCLPSDKVDDWQATFREFANPTPPIAEPEGIGAVVHAATRKGGPRRIFVSHHPDNDDDRTRWVDVDGDWHGWVNLVHPEVLAQGYTPEAKS